ncbi:hypothetical protein NPIL_328791 [Nephila pilipes]|uniref:Uncharacterized protein n=1 Tax=Nephila pilipes TaxID=299642 RepID=A0A8X6U1Y5_NEPPI|nr:hypothetical protein NPIL_328791 [Nephila pilipes]
MIVSKSRIHKILSVFWYAYAPWIVDMLEQALHHSATFLALFFQIYRGRNKFSIPFSPGCDKEWVESYNFPKFPRQLKSVTNYLKIKLQHDMKQYQLAAEQVGIASSINQANYSYYPNRLKKYESFEIGDKVIVVAPDSTHNMYARWTTPFTIIGKRSAHSYLVQMPDNSVKHIYRY